MRRFVFALLVLGAAMVAVMRATTGPAASGPVQITISNGGPATFGSDIQAASMRTSFGNWDTRISMFRMK